MIIGRMPSAGFSEFSSIAIFGYDFHTRQVATVDRSVQGQGLGASLLVDAIRRSAQISEQVGIRAVEVDALDEAARNFYLKFGFRSLLDDARHLFLPMHEIRKLNLEPL